ncbi:MAG: hypothetical protein D6707_03815 [Bacteroidetes bacterium]|nr:MAG: hypothetical protein D6707_03815 [Bacteroidota bacterium]
MATSCNIINPPEQIPSYIAIDTIILETEPGQGTDKHAITDAWIYINNDIQGIYELPVTQAPLLFTGKQNLKIAGGIKHNGKILERPYYPFYDFYTNDTSFYLYPDSVVTVSAIVKYFDGLQFKWMQDFEGDTLQFEIPDTSVHIIKYADNPFEGNYSGIVTLTADTPGFMAKSPIYEFPKAENIYLEFHYKTEAEIQVGTITVNDNDEEVSLLTLFYIPPKYDLNGNLVWNKIYLDLTDEINSEYNANYTKFKIFLAAYNTDNKKIYLDNIQIIHP